MALPLLKLPCLVILQFLELMSFVELFFLSQVSQKMGRIIKKHSKIRDHVLELSIDEDVSIDLVSLKTKLPVSSVVLRPCKKLETSPFISNFNLKFGKCGGIPCISTNLGFGFASVELYSDDFTLSKEIYDKISYIFSLPLIKTKMNLSGTRDNYKWTVEWLNTFNIPEIEICGNLCDFAQYTDTIQTIKSSGKVIFGARPASFHTLEALDVNLEHVTFDKGEWIKPHYLESMNSNFIRISKAIFSDRDINQFLHALKRGSYPNLQEMTMEFDRRIATDVIFAGLNAYGTPYHRNFDLDNGKRCSVWYGVYKANLRGVEVRIEENVANLFF